MSEKAKPRQGHTIFIVEDDTDLADMLTQYFTKQGYDVRHAGRGEDAVRLICAQPPDIAVLDIRLPDIDGYEVCTRLRQNRQTQNMPVIFLTEKREQQDKLAGLELGAVDYITKPFDIQELRLRIRNVLRRFQHSAMVNPITGLAEGVLMKERLEKVLTSSDWGIVLAEIDGLHHFRDKYGFVAADDVSRAVALMLTNAIQETGSKSDFVGHLDSTNFLLVTSTAECKKLARRCEMRLHASIPYFYPALERHRVREMQESERLRIRVSSLSADEHAYQGLDTLFADLTQRS